MDRYNWQDRQHDRNDRRNWDEGRQVRDDQSYFRGAYRLETEGPDRNVTTYNGFDSGRDNDETHGGNYVYRRSRNLQDNNHYSSHQHRQGDSRLREESRANFGNRYGGGAGRGYRNSRFEDERGQRRTYYGGRVAGNFDGDYRPDSYGRGQGENYGNMAGSLSYGYDGGYNSDPDYNRHYNPLTGEIRSYRDNYSERHPRRYGPPDSTGSNPDYDRY